MSKVLAEVMAVEAMEDAEHKDSDLVCEYFYDNLDVFAKMVIADNDDDLLENSKLLIACIKEKLADYYEDFAFESLSE